MRPGTMRPGTMRPGTMRPGMRPETKVSVPVPGDTTPTSRRRIPSRVARRRRRELSASVGDGWRCVDARFGGEARALVDDARWDTLTWRDTGAGSVFYLRDVELAVDPGTTFPGNGTRRRTDDAAGHGERRLDEHERLRCLGSGFQTTRFRSGVVSHLRGRFSGGARRRRVSRRGWAPGPTPGADPGAADGRWTTSASGTGSYIALRSFGLDSTSAPFSAIGTHRKTSHLLFSAPGTHLRAREVRGGGAVGIGQSGRVGGGRAGGGVARRGRAGAEVRDALLLPSPNAACDDVRLRARRLALAAGRHGAAESARQP